TEGTGTDRLQLIRKRARAARVDLARHELYEVLLLPDVQQSDSLLGCPRNLRRRLNSQRMAHETVDQSVLGVQVERHFEACSIAVEEVACYVLTRVVQHATRSTRPVKLAVLA